ncbi:MAG: hypothetical protein ACXU82_07740 [Caulobacteraceae bacterium]
MHGPYWAGVASVGALWLGEALLSAAGAGALGWGAASCVTVGAGAGAGACTDGAAAAGETDGAGVTEASGAGAARWTGAADAGRVLTASDAGAALRATFTGAGAEAGDLAAATDSLAAAVDLPERAASAGVCAPSLLARASFRAGGVAGLAGAGVETEAVWPGAPTTSLALWCGVLVAATTPMIATAATGKAIQP